MKFAVAPLLIIAMGNSLSDADGLAAETAANASFPLADVTTLDAPLALRITGSGAADGRYLLREGVPVAGLRCAKRDGVYWENEANAYVLEARDGSATKWSIANATDAAADAWLYGSDSAGCDPTEFAWLPNAGVDGHVSVDAARADCYYETRHYETWNSPWGSFGIATKVVESKYLVCGIDKEARLFTTTVGREVHQGKKGDEQPRAFFAGELCAATDEPSAAACVDALCSGEPAEGRGTCPGRVDRSVRGGTDKKSKGVSQLTITVITALFVAGLFLAAATRASCSLRVAEHRRRQKIHPLGGEDEHPVYPSLERVRRARVEGRDLGDGDWDPRLTPEAVAVRRRGDPRHIDLVEARLAIAAARGEDAAPLPGREEAPPRLTIVEALAGGRLRARGAHEDDAAASPPAQVPAREEPV